MTIKGIQTVQESYIITKILRIVYHTIIFYSTNTSSQIKILTSFFQNLALISQIIYKGHKVLEPFLDIIDTI
jgi:hypothetical protein